jgi:hypothetical protein
MAFSLLPTELTLSIVGYLDPDSTLHFALACKEHATLCKSVLKEHGARFSEWQVIDTTNGNTLLWKRLKELIQYPSLGWYVRELNLPTTRQYSWNPGEHNIQDGPSYREKDLFAREAGKLQGLYPLLEQNYYHKYDYHFHGIANPHDLIGTIQERINSGHEDGIIAIILHYLPYLHTIRITDVDTNGLELILYRIAKAYRSPDQSPRLPLKHLKTATIAHWDTELSCSPDWACYFSSMPSVRTIAARAMGNKPHDFIAKQLCSNRSSNVTELFLEQCQMDVNGLATMFWSIKNLTKFTYTAGGDMVSDMGYEPKRVIKALLEHAADTLEELTLDQEYYGEDVCSPPSFTLSLNLTRWTTKPTYPTSPFAASKPLNSSTSNGPSCAPQPPKTPTTTSPWSKASSPKKTTKTSTRSGMCAPSCPGRWKRCTSTAISRAMMESTSLRISGACLRRRVR